MDSPTTCLGLVRALPRHKPLIQRMNRVALPKGASHEKTWDDLHDAAAHTPTARLRSNQLQRLVEGNAID